MEHQEVYLVFPSLEEECALRCFSLCFRFLRWCSPSLLFFFSLPWLLFLRLLDLEPCLLLLWCFPCLPLLACFLLYLWCLPLLCLPPESYIVINFPLSNISTHDKFRKKMAKVESHWSKFIKTLNQSKCRTLRELFHCVDCNHHKSKETN